MPIVVCTVVCIKTNGFLFTSFLQTIVLGLSYDDLTVCLDALTGMMVNQWETIQNHGLISRS